MCGKGRRDAARRAEASAAQLKHSERGWPVETAMSQPGQRVMSLPLLNMSMLATASSRVDGAVGERRG